MSPILLGGLLKYIGNPDPGLVVVSWVGLGARNGKWKEKKIEWGMGNGSGASDF